MDGIQAWVALPDEREETDPGFWHYPSQALPVLDGDGIAGRLSAGRLAGVESPVKVDSPQFYVHWQLRAGSRTTLPAEYSERAVYAAKRLVDELPEGTPAPDVIKHWLKRAREDDAARGVEWPNITPEQQGKAGLAWSVFPNMSILLGITFALFFRARPYGDDPKIGRAHV